MRLLNAGQPQTSASSASSSMQTPSPSPRDPSSLHVTGPLSSFTTTRSTGIPSWETRSTSVCFLSHPMISVFTDHYTPLGGKILPPGFHYLMFPHPEDRAGHEYPEDGLLQAYGVVKGDEIRQPQYLDAHGEKVLFVVKNGQATGTTVGRANGLESFARIYIDHGIDHTSIEIAILPFSRQQSPFSAPGDSGSIILDRAGRIVALLTGGCGRRTSPTGPHTGGLWNRSQWPIPTATSTRLSPFRPPPLRPLELVNSSCISWTSWFVLGRPLYV